MASLSSVRKCCSGISLPLPPRPARSDEARAAIGPVAVLQKALVELARRVTRQLRVEIDRARAFDMADMAAAEVDQLFLELRPRKAHVDGLDHRLHLLAEILVRYADHRRVIDLRVGDEQVLDLLRIDIHAAGDDHIGLPVGQIEEAVLVEIADIAERAPALLGEALRRPLRAVVIGELAPAREIADADAPP